jgi:hypothetical protein
MEIREIAGQRCLVAPQPARPLADAIQVLRLFGDAIGEDASTIVVEASALSPGFFDLRTGFAGEVLQKAANYRIRFAVVGDITSYVETSNAFHDLVVESERATGYCFVADLEALERWLAPFAGR